MFFIFTIPQGFFANGHENVVLVPYLNFICASYRNINTAGEVGDGAVDSGDIDAVSSQGTADPSVHFLCIVCLENNFFLTRIKEHELALVGVSKIPQAFQVILE